MTHIYTNPMMCLLVLLPFDRLESLGKGNLSWENASTWVAMVKSVVHFLHWWLTSVTWKGPDHCGQYHHGLTLGSCLEFWPWRPWKMNCSFKMKWTFSSPCCFWSCLSCLTIDFRPKYETVRGQSLQILPVTPYEGPIISFINHRAGK